MTDAVKHTPGLMVSPDNLRERADFADELGYRDHANILRDAADTIDALWKEPVPFTDSQQQAQDALSKVMNERFSNFDAGAVIYWAERGLYQVKQEGR